MALHPDARRLLADLGEPTDPADVDLTEQRRAAREAALAVRSDSIGIDHVQDLDADGVPVRLYRPRAGAPVALYVHGGGWVLHDLETHDAFCRYLASTTGWALLAVDYRRAPEHPYPAPLDDVVAAARWLRREAPRFGVEASFLPGIGDSAGGNLVAGAVVRDRDLLDLQVLLYPATDPRAELNADDDNPALDAVSMRWMWRAYAEGAFDEPEVAVLRAPSPDRLPPALVVTAEHDALRDQGEAYAARLADAGVRVTGWRALGMVHSFWRQPQAFDAARDLVVMVGSVLDAHRCTSPPPTGGRGSKRGSG